MDFVKVFKALGNEFRLQVVVALLQGNIHSCCGEVRAYEQGCCVTDLTGRFAMAQSTISHHLGILVDAGIIQMEKRGPWSVYLIAPAALDELRGALGSWLAQGRDVHCSRGPRAPKEGRKGDRTCKGTCASLPG